MKFFIVAAALLALAAADQPYRQAYPAPAAPLYKTATYEKPVEEPRRPHAFDYAVKDAETYADFAHVENSDGKTVSGEYRVNLPDGRIQVVKYKADDYGNVADVSYIGEAKYPEEKPAYKAVPQVYTAPAYKAAPQAYAAPAYKVPAYQTPAGKPQY